MYSHRESPARLVFATPSGDRHEIGTLGAAMLAASSGLGVSYIGPDVPADELVSAVEAAHADVLVLGLTLHRRHAAIERELKVIVRTLPSKTELWVGGAGADHFAKLVGRRGLLLRDFDALSLQLQRLRDRTV